MCMNQNERRRLLRTYDVRFDFGSAWKRTHLPIHNYTRTQSEGCLYVNWFCTCRYIYIYIYTKQSYTYTQHTCVRVFIVSSIYYTSAELRASTGSLLLASPTHLWLFDAAGARKQCRNSSPTFFARDRPLSPRHGRGWAPHTYTQYALDILTPPPALRCARTRAVFVACPRSLALLSHL